jgi:amidase
MSWETIASQKRAALKDSIPSQWIIPSDIFPAEDQADVTAFPRESGFFTEHELEITSTNAADILKKVANKEWTAVEVAEAFCKTAAVAQQLVSLPCFTPPIPGISYYRIRRC